MSNDLLQHFSALRESLKQEREQLVARIARINEVLGTTMARPQRARNPMSLKETVIKVTSDRFLNKEEILEEVQNLGYQFNTSNPINSLNVILYGKKPKFKREGRRFMFGKR